MANQYTVKKPKIKSGGKTITKGRAKTPKVKHTLKAKAKGAGGR